MPASPPSIPATPAARAALAHVIAAHGPVLFHLTGGCCDAGKPLCLPRADMRIGARDMLLGMIDDTPLYHMPSHGNACPIASTMMLNLAPGFAAGFSLPAGDGLTFVLA